MDKIFDFNRFKDVLKQDFILLWKYPAICFILPVILVCILFFIDFRQIAESRNQLEVDPFLYDMLADRITLWVRIFCIICLLVSLVLTSFIYKKFVDKKRRTVPINDATLAERMLSRNVIFILPPALFMAINCSLACKIPSYEGPNDWHREMVETFVWVFTFLILNLNLNSLLSILVKRFSFLAALYLVFLEWRNDWSIGDILPINSPMWLQVTVPILIALILWAGLFALSYKLLSKREAQF